MTFYSWSTSEPAHNFGATIIMNDDDILYVFPRIGGDTYIKWTTMPPKWFNKEYLKYRKPNYNKITSWKSLFELIYPGIRINYEWKNISKKIIKINIM
jgi:hypothetical protein